MSIRNNDRGAALITVLVLLALLSGLLAASAALTRMEMRGEVSSMNATRGFYAAEAGLNVRASQIRQEFEGFRRPAGSAPALAPGRIPCSDDGNQGSGDFACNATAFENRTVRSYVTERPTNPSSIRIAPGEIYQNLLAQEYGYLVSSISVGPESRPEAIVDMEFKSRLVPLFQFAAFYNKDLEILPGPDMTLEGPVHANGDLYVGAISSLTIGGQVTTTGTLSHGRKDSDTCQGGGVRIFDPGIAAPLPDCGPGRVEISPATAARWNGMIRTGVDRVQVPEPESLDAAPGRVYWDRADLRVMLKLESNGASFRHKIEVRNPDNTVDHAASGQLAGACHGAVESTSGEFFNHRESLSIEMLEVDVRALMDCISGRPAIQSGRGLDDGTDGGLVWYFGIDGPDAARNNNYGVRIKGGEELAPSDPFAAQIRGLSIVSDQAAYIQGDFNSDGWKPAAFLADSLNVLSNNWHDGNSRSALAGRVAGDTEINAAFLAGTDTTGGALGRDRGDYNGGLENYPRFHETWSGKQLTYRGSFVSLNEPRHVQGRWSDQSYSPPRRDWGFELRFNDAANLPPLTPRFVFLKQQLFERAFEY